MEEVLSSLAHDATSNKVKSVRDACISATGKLRAVGQNSLLKKNQRLIISVFAFQMVYLSIVMEREKCNHTS